MHQRASLQPIKIGPLSLTSRVYVPAHSYGFPPTNEGIDAFVAYVHRRLIAGVPMMVIGEAEVPNRTLQSANGILQGRIAGASSQELYSRLYDVMDQTGGNIVEQLYHPGGQVWFEEQRACFAPSSYPQPRSYMLPFEMNTDFILEVQNAFVSSALIVKKSGLSGIEIKADQGKLFHQFLSREYNQRHDKFGGVLENRLRFLLETLDQIRRNVGSEFAIGVRLSGPVTPPVAVDPLAQVTFSDITLDETIEIAQRLDESGLIDYISISGETNSTVWGYSQNHGDEDVTIATFKDVTAQLKRNVHLPILLAGRILNLDVADDLLTNNFCDVVGMARAFIADAELLKRDKPKDSPLTVATIPRPCIVCNSCIGKTWYGSSISCIYDPLSGRESSFPMIQARRRKHFAVVGAGAAGLEFARAASVYGATVTIFEASNYIGGRLHDWRKLPGRSSVSKAIEFWERICDNDARINLIRECIVRISSDEMVEYDGIVVARGAQSIIPSFIQKPFAGKHLTPGEALKTDCWADKNVIVVDGDRYSDPLGIASWVGSQGASITVVTAFDQVGVGLDPVSRASRLNELNNFGAVYHTWCDIRQTASGELALFDHCSNRLFALPFVDMVIWCVNLLPEELVSTSDDYRINYIGDCKWPRGLEIATKEAHDLAYKLVQQD